MEECGEFSEAEEVASEGGGTGVAIGGASGKAAELSDPPDGQVEGWGCSRRGGRLEHAAGEGLPLVGVEEVGAGAVWLSASQAGREEDAPGDDAGEGKAPV